MNLKTSEERICHPLGGLYAEIRFTINLPSFIENKKGQKRKKKDFKGGKNVKGAQEDFSIFFVGTKRKSV